MQQAEDGESDGGDGHGGQRADRHDPEIVFRPAVHRGLSPFPGRSFNGDRGAIVPCTAQNGAAPLHAISDHVRHKAGAQSRSLRESWADTTSSAGRLMITIIGGIAEFERELIRAGDGIKRAKAAGVHMGRPSKLAKHQQREILARLARGEETLVEIARSYAVSHMTISRLKERHAAS
jgi:hypothetical protein